MTPEQIEEANTKRTAPRVELKDVMANIQHEEFVTHVSHSGQVLRWCVLTVANGFAVTGEPSAAASPENDNEELGKHYARENAIRKLWPLMAYGLKETIHQEASK